MSIEPSCPVLVVHDDDSFRKNLIAALDARHFTVTFAADGEGAVDVLRERAKTFKVMVLELLVKSGTGMRSLSYLRDHRDSMKCGLIVVGDPDPSLRTLAPWADEMLLKPVDPVYVATRAQVYCNC